MDLNTVERNLYKHIRGFVTYDFKLLKAFHIFGTRFSSKKVRNKRGQFFGNHRCKDNNDNSKKTQAHAKTSGVSNKGHTQSVSVWLSGHTRIKAFKCFSVIAESDKIIK